MILEAEQSFALTHPQGQLAALAFVRDPALALSRVRFLRGLVGSTEGVRGELIVPVPVLGEVDLPFHSLLLVTEDGATLTPQPIADERAWVEVSGTAATDSAGQIRFQFHFVAHLATPEAEGWGGAAFEKMVRAAAGRTLERVARELPQGIGAAVVAQAGVH
ncbi:MAG: hypothetical protein JWQ08_2009 [Deinococcus sp.]|nr:hypothetical protein [Deinococcus sp.]